MAKRFAQLTLPEGVYAAVAEASELHGQRIFPEEEQLLREDAAPSRKLQFTLGRLAAHDALHQAHVPPAPVLKDDHGYPSWPPGVCGSISHAHTLAVALISTRPDVRSVGVDVERLDRELSHDIAERICSVSERPFVQSPESLLRIFSAKEALYKALHPIYHRFIGFHGAALTPNGTDGFTAELSANLGFQPQHRTLAIRSIVDAGHVLSFVLVRCGC